MEDFSFFLMQELGRSKQEQQLEQTQQELRQKEEHFQVLLPFRSSVVAELLEQV